LLKGNVADLCTQAGMALLALVIVVTAQGYPDSARYFPTLIGSITFVLACALLVKTIKESSGLSGKKIEKATILRWIPTAAGIVGCILFIYLLGYRLGGILYMAGLIWFLGYRKPLLVAVWAVVGVIAIWLLFAKLLLVPLPTGILWQLI